jgi:hypothetical protein
MKRLWIEDDDYLAPMLRMGEAMPQLPRMSSRRARGQLNHFVPTPNISFVYNANVLPEQIPVFHIAMMQQDGAFLQLYVQN